MNAKALFKRYKFRFLSTFVLILLEAGILLLFPLFIGHAIDGIINGSKTGVFALGGLGVALLLVGVGRRVFDSRFYGKVYRSVGHGLVKNMSWQPASVKTARLGMLQEFVEFLENALPELINSIIGVVGVIVILAGLNMPVFWGSLVVTALIFLVYWLTSGKTMAYNKEANDQMERQVAVLDQGNDNALEHHLARIVKWNMKLSDLEAVNFSFSWLGALAFLVSAILVSVSDGILEYGSLFALVMYVFQYIENVLALPMFYQNWLRLQEIMNRLAHA